MDGERREGIRRAGGAAPRSRGCARLSVPDDADGSPGSKAAPHPAVDTPRGLLLSSFDHPSDRFPARRDATGDDAGARLQPLVDHRGLIAPTDGPGAGTG